MEKKLNIGNVLQDLKFKHDNWVGNQTDQITSENSKGFKDGLAWAISRIEHCIELENFQEKYDLEEAERIALQSRYIYDENGNGFCDGFPI